MTIGIHSLPTRDPGKKASSHTNTQPSVSDIFTQTSAYPAEQKPRHRSPKSCSAQPVVNTTIGERTAPTIVIVTIVTVIHMLPTCVGHPQNLLLPHPHSLLFAFIVVVQSIG